MRCEVTAPVAGQRCSGVREIDLTRMYAASPERFPPMRLPHIPEARDELRWYGVELNAGPPYVLYGMVRTPKAGRVIGILAFAGNEFHGQLLRRALDPFGLVKLERTEWHGGAGRHFPVLKFLQKSREQGPMRLYRKTAPAGGRGAQSTGRRGSRRRRRFGQRKPSRAITNRLQWATDLARSVYRKQETHVIYTKLGKTSWRAFVVNTDNKVLLMITPLAPDQLTALEFLLDELLLLEQSAVQDGFVPIDD